MELLDMDLLATLTRIDELIWGLPLLVLLIGTGVFLTWRLGLIQVFRLPLALRYVLISRKAEIGVQGDVSSFAALSTAPAKQGLISMTGTFLTPLLSAL
ncbi:MAG: hypothetical protein QUS12_04500 [Methanosarcina sp.]|nr:hypothetical protein [Methanosarcina sp.]